MRKLSLVLMSGVFALSLSGCNLFGGGDEAAVVEPTPVPVPSEEATESTPEEATVAEPPPSAVSVASADLIRSTDPNQRIQQINQGQRQDPFSTLVIPPPPVPQPAAATTPVGPTSPGGAAPAQVPQVPQLPTTGAPATRQQPQSPAATGAPRPQPQTPGARPSAPGARPSSPLSPGAIAALPPIPQPDLAAAVVVTGVVQVGNMTHAIVNAPNEDASRYVQVGQRIANGQVLVKRIEMGGASEPVVILEQNGVEVAKRVGEGVPADPTTQQTASTAALPVS